MATEVSCRLLSSFIENEAGLYLFDFLLTFSYFLVLFRLYRSTDERLSLPRSFLKLSTGRRATSRMLPNFLESRKRRVFSSSMSLLKVSEITWSSWTTSPSTFLKLTGSWPVSISFYDQERASTEREYRCSRLYECAF